MSIKIKKSSSSLKYSCNVKLNLLFVVALNSIDVDTLTNH